MSGHTAGPWSVRTHKNGYPEVYAPGGLIIAEVWHPPVDDGAAEANALLIAAAPDLLANACALLCICKQVLDPRRVPEMEWMGTAIAKATGAQP